MSEEKAVIEDGILCRSEYDIDENGNICTGRTTLLVKDGIYFLEVGKDGEAPKFSYKVDSLKRLSIISNIGCATLEADFKDESSVRLCRMTQSCVKPLSEFIKVINYYIETGTMTEMKEEHTHCPKCGKPFVANTQFCINCADKSSIIKKFIVLGKRYIPSFLFAGLLVLICNLANLMIPILNRILVDEYLFPASEGLKPWGDTNPYLAIIGLVLAMFGIYVFVRVVNILAARLRNKSGVSFMNELRTKMYEKIQFLSMSSISRRTTGDLIKRVTEDTSVISDFLKTETAQIIEVGVIFICVSAYFIVTRPILALFVFLPVPITMFAISRFWKFIHRQYGRQWILGSRANGILHDIIKGIRVVKVFGTEEKEIKKYDYAAEKQAEISAQNEEMWAILFPALGFVIGLGEFLVLYFGAWAVLGESVIGPPMTVGELTQIISYTGYIYGPLRWMTNLPRSLANAITSMAKLTEILDEEPDIKDHANVVSPEIHGDIEFKNVTFGYKSYEPVLKNVSLKINQGEMVGIVGHSGVGKSTFINLVMRLYDVNSGSLLIDGTDIRDIEKQTLNTSIGVVFQETFLFAGSIYDNILYARPDAPPEDVFAAAKIANAHDFIIKLPDAYNTIVGEHGYSLSGGERQRIAIARAVLRDPKILILDEATASLDTETESKIQEALQRLTKGRTTIAIAHRLSTLRNADRLIVLEKGELAEFGTHEELLKNKGIYYNLVMAQRQTTKMAKVNK